MPIIAAVAVFLYKIATAPTQPVFTIERLVRHAALRRIEELAKSCSSTVRGNGVEYERLLKRLDGHLTRMDTSCDGECELWKYVLKASIPVVRAAIDLCNAKLGEARKIGHVRGVPRLFLLCDYIVGLTCGSIDKSFVESAVDAFCKFAPLGYDEMSQLLPMLAFCLLGVLERTLFDAIARDSEYEKGLTDGAAGQVGLDMLFSCDYVCGIIDSANDDGALKKLFDDNEISSFDEKLTRRERLSELAETIDSIVRSLCVLSEKEHGTPFSRDRGTYVFGGETRRICNRFQNRRLTVCTDNRGVIEISDSARRFFANFAASVTVNGKTIQLSDTDGVFQCNNTLYRTVADGLEYSADVIAPPTDGCMLVRVSVVNRTPQPISATISAACRVRAADGNVLRSKSIKNIGILLSADEYEVGLCADTQCDYAANEAEQSVCAERYTEVGAFEKRSVMFAVSIGKKLNAPQLYRYSDELYFLRSLVAAQAYYADNYAGTLIDDNTQRFVYRDVKQDMYAPTVDCASCIFERGAGGFTDDGYSIEVGATSKYALTGMLFDGEVFADVKSDGNEKTVLSGGGEYGSMNVVLDEDGVVWSPFGSLAGDGATCEFCRGYIVYRSVRNGCLTTLTRTVARGKRAEILLVAVDNRTDIDRCIDVMLTSEADSDARIVKNGDTVYAVGKNGFALMSSESPAEYCEYKEGYLDHGRIARASNFLSGGETLAPTLSVRLYIPARSEKKVAFCRALNSGGILIDGITVEDAEEYIACEAEYYKSSERITLRSSDPLLNAVHAHSLYVARALLDKYMYVGRYDRALLTCFAAKYADPDCVCDALLSLFEKQESCGRLDIGRKTQIATLLLPLATIDLINYRGDCRLFSESVSFSVGRLPFKKASVLEHCFRAIDFSILMSASMDEKADRAFSALLLRAAKAFIEYSTNTDRVKAYSLVISRLAKREEYRRKALEAAQIEFDPLGVATAFARYEAYDCEGAYQAVKELADKAFSDGVFRLYADPDGVTASLFYTLITERLLGISVRGDRAKISPNTAANTPHLEFDISSDFEKTHILIDDSDTVGSWQINYDRISIASDTIRLCDTAADVVIRRNGNAG